MLFKEIGTIPWRAQQFADLAQFAWENYPKMESASEKFCEQKDGEWIPHPTLAALSFSGLLAHFTGDATMPYHSATDWDGVSTGQRGIHWYLESILVDGLNEWTLDYWVAQKAKKLLEAGAGMVGSPAYLRSVAAAQYGDSLKRAEVAGLILTVLADSYSKIKEVQKLDATYAIATVREAIELPHCAELDSVKRVKEELSKLQGEKKDQLLNAKLMLKPTDKDEACRRTPHTMVNKDGIPGRGEMRTVAQWHQDLIEDRLAISVALTADIWVRTWLRGHAPAVCSTRQYAHKPWFISPADPNCFGYALDEGPKNFNSIAPSVFKAQNRESCAQFE